MNGEQIYEMMKLLDLTTRQRDEAIEQCEDLLEIGKQLKAKCEKVEAQSRALHKQLEELQKYSRVYGCPN